MKKIFLIIGLSLILLPTLALAAGAIVNCGLSSQPGDRCTLDSVKGMPIIVINFIKDNFILPVAIILVTIGGLVMLFSAGNPNLLGLGKKIIFAALIGGFLAYGAAMIVNIILSALGGKTI